MDAVQDVTLRRQRSIALRFRNGNLALFALASAAMAIAIFWAIRDMAGQVATDYARLHAINAARTFSLYVNRDIGVIADAARSQAVVDWFTDETHPQKRKDAHAAMASVVSSLHGSSLYVGIQKTFSEYVIEAESALDDMKPHALLDPSNPEDAWYFSLMAAGKDYLLNVDTDKKLLRKRVWFNHKVISPTGELLGAFTAGVPFSRAAEKIFAAYRNTKVRGVLIDGKGIVMMDSTLLGKGDLLLNAPQIAIREISSDPAFLAAIQAHLADTGTYFPLQPQPVVVTLSSKQYEYATIAPIGFTDWAVVTFYAPSSLFEPTRLLPFCAIMAALLTAFAISSSILSYRLIFRPLGHLILNLSRLKNTQERIYGLERDDELGILSNVIHRLLNEARHDPLTSLHNKRAMEEGMQRAMESLSRSGGMLSVLMIDVDCFKGYNDMYGHAAGDTCLKTLASVLAANVTRVDDLVARYGGEEFVVILPNTGQDGVCKIAQRLLEGVRKLRMPHGASTVADHVTFSIGAASGMVHHAQNQDEYISRADEALYASKQAGRNRYTWLPMQASSSV
ncbi:MAG: sensor domain-containing diguanylate cyclase [Deltaproteobacteria bacterium]|nr:sensor domain-containing diguanylate cyclase [Deltaproteobacteria bacterium]